MPRILTRCRRRPRARPSSMRLAVSHPELVQARSGSRRAIPSSIGRSAAQVSRRYAQSSVARLDSSRAELSRATHYLDSSNAELTESPSRLGSSRRGHRRAFFRSRRAARRRREPLDALDEQTERTRCSATAAAVHWQGSRRSASWQPHVPFDLQHPTRRIWQPVQEDAWQVAAPPVPVAPPEEFAPPDEATAPPAAVAPPLSVVPPDPSMPPVPIEPPALFAPPLAAPPSPVTAPPAADSPDPPFPVAVAPPASLAPPVSLVRSDPPTPLAAPLPAPPAATVVPPFPATKPPLPVPEMPFAPPLSPPVSEPVPVATSAPLPPRAPNPASKESTPPTDCPTAHDAGLASTKRAQAAALLVAIPRRTYIECKSVSHSLGQSSHDHFTKGSRDLGRARDFCHLWVFGPGKVGLSEETQMPWCSKRERP